jgi:hypothetical protein
VGKDDALNTLSRGTAAVNSIRRRWADKCPIYYPAFCLQILALISLTAVPGAADPGSGKGEHYGLYQPLQRSAALDADSNQTSTDPAAGALLAMAEFPVLDKTEQKPEAGEKPIEPVTRKLPIWGEQARERGFELPLPFGIGANYTYMDQGIRIRNLKVGVGNPNIELKGLDFNDARSHDSAVTARLDMWLLPFLNLYGLFGSINGQAEFDLDVSQITGGLPGLPPIIEPNKTISLNFDYNGFTFGGGITLAGGYENIFATLDTNYTYSTVNIVDGRIDTVTVAPRLGLLVDPPEIQGSFALWIGAMYMHYKQTVSNDISLQELDPRLPPVELAFKLDIENDSPWCFLFGGQWQITKRLQIMAEGGGGGRGQLVTGISFRF